MLLPGKPKPGGLFANNKPAFVDSTLAANKQLDWVKRLREHNAPTMQVPGEPERSTHFMGDDGQGYVFPTVVRQPGQQKLSYLGNRAEDYARETNTGIQFPSKAKGDYFGHNGYKQGTGVNNSIDAQGRPYNNPKYRPAVHKAGGQLVMLGPDGKPQMDLGQGGNRIFSRDNTRELVNTSLKAKTPAELKALGGRIKAMLNKQDRNKPEYVKD